MSDVEYIAGGATQNSIRVAQWMLQVRLEILLRPAGPWQRQSSICDSLSHANDMFSKHHMLDLREAWHAIHACLVSKHTHVIFLRLTQVLPTRIFS